MWHKGTVPRPWSWTEPLFRAKLEAVPAWNLGILLNFSLYGFPYVFNGELASLLVNSRDAKIRLCTFNFRHTSEILQVHLKMAAIKWISQKSESHKIFGFQMHTKVMFKLYCSLLKTWELDCQESWALKNWCFWTVVLEKTLESPLDRKEIQPVHSRDQP